MSEPGFPRTESCTAECRNGRHGFGCPHDLEKIVGEGVPIAPMLTDQEFVETCHSLLDQLGFAGRHVPLDHRLRQLVVTWQRIQRDLDVVRRVARVSANDWREISSILIAYKVYAYDLAKVDELLVKIEVASDKERGVPSAEQSPEAWLASRELADLSIYWPTNKPQPQIDYESGEAKPTLTGLMEAYADKVAALRETAARAELQKEIKELRGWKESAMSIMGQLDLQAIGQELEMPLGVEISSAVLPAIKKLKERETAARADENEKCAKIADAEAAVPREEGGTISRTDACMNVAAAIRAALKEPNR